MKKSIQMQIVLVGWVFSSLKPSADSKTKVCCSPTVLKRIRANVDAKEGRIDWERKRVCLLSIGDKKEGKGSLSGADTKAQRSPASYGLTQANANAQTSSTAEKTSI